jgi:peptidoglycan/LPS O-acetylase OafA/YrhL
MTDDNSADADVQRRAYRALNEDGLVDFSLGLGLSFCALYIGLWRLAGINMAVWSGLFPIFVMLIARGLRKRFVYPRIGYARVRNASPAILLMATLGFLLVAGLVVMTIYARRGMRPPGALVPWMLRLFALAGAAVLALMGRRTGLVRFYVHAAVILVAALASAAVSNTDYGLILMLGPPGLALLVTGTVCFCLFLRRHPKPEATHANS